jgi:DMSO/TMAO reductase YedYZ molybdopterin-dependent catalytic subunit
MSVQDALQSGNLLCYQMKGEPLPPEHGFPVRLGLSPLGGMEWPMSSG